MYVKHVSQANFNPPAPCGAGPAQQRIPRRPCDFNPPAPCGAGRLPGCIYLDKGGISIHPPRAGRDYYSGSATQRIFISIHPPRAGRDERVSTSGEHFGDFNPPAPCGAGQLLTEYNTLTGLFQSTRPVRGGTSAAIAAKTIITISIHPPRAGRDAIWCLWRWAAF